jgi:hypothetical protein
VYQIDKQNVLYRVLHKLTDRHLKPFAQDAMRVSLAAQVMSNTVAAAIDTHVTAGKEKCFIKGSLGEQPCNIFHFLIYTLYSCKSQVMYMFVIFFAGHMEKRCLTTATFVNEVDELFDSFNGVTRKPDHGKLLRCRVSSSSKHVEYWGSDSIPCEGERALVQ